VRLYHEVTGDGPAVVLIHEGICDCRMWDPQWESLAGDFRLVRLDLRGFGRSPLPPEPFSNVRDVLDVMDAVGVDQAALVGVSMGGRVALECAFAAPARVSALVLVGAGLPDFDWSPALAAFGEAEEAAIERGDLDAAAELNVRFWVDGPHRRPEDVDPALRDRVREMQRRAFELQLETWEQAPQERIQELTPRLGEIKAPALVLVGELDQPDMLAIADLLARSLPNATSGTIAATAHVPTIERPEEFDRLLREFLAGVAAG
jgi:3-oxoadipate enol-lactonase